MFVNFLTEIREAESKCKCSVGGTYYTVGIAKQIPKKPKAKSEALDAGSNLENEEESNTPVCMEPKARTLPQSP